jgi:UDP-N-acetylmuramate dehydrogenase
MTLDIQFLKQFNIAVSPGAFLSGYTTFKLGGPCTALIHCQTPRQIEEAVCYFFKSDLKFILIGGGSNLLVRDQGIDCYVIRYSSETPIIECHDNELTVAACSPIDPVARFAAEAGLEGLNCMTGIPGTVAGAIVGNAGAFGRQISDALKSVRVIDRQGQTNDIPASALTFSYRNSSFKESGDIIVAAKFALHPGDKSILRKDRREILALRREKHPDLAIHPCAGSFFRNVEPTSHAGKRQAAGWFLDQAGAKDMKAGGAAVFAGHANIIVKSDGCSSQDVYALSQRMARAVKEKFDIDLVREVMLVGQFEGAPEETNTVLF